MSVSIFISTCRYERPAVLICLLSPALRWTNSNKIVQELGVKLCCKIIGNTTKQFSFFVFLHLASFTTQISNFLKLKLKRVSSLLCKNWSLQKPKHVHTTWFFFLKFEICSAFFFILQSISFKVRNFNFFLLHVFYIVRNSVVWIYKHFIFFCIP